MAAFEIEGGARLSGSIRPQGAKNEALEVICACLLTPEEVILHNVPDILDVNILIDILKDLGVTVVNKGSGTFTFQARTVDVEALNYPEVRSKAIRLRGSIMIVGPLLARFGLGYIPQPGGDKIGRRRVDTHFIGFEKLGAKALFRPEEGVFCVEAHRLKGAYMLLDEASVTGTANLLMAASLADGVTTLYNAACEPYVQQLCRMLNRMGARIMGVGSNLLTIEGVASLNGCEHTLLPDMIEVGS
ncbi:MAG: UDP-N-acetylglucosamine 1-carboxyvinyltransferase, partial [Bacteroidales bacterium]